MSIDVTIRGTGTKVKQCLVNGKESRDGFLRATDEGRQEVTVNLAE